MRSDLKNSRDLKIEGRQSIHCKNMSTASPAENGDVDGMVESNLTLAHDQNMKFSRQTECHRITEHSESRNISLEGNDTQRCIVDSLGAIDETPETKHLKDLLLLHLDWIQQQQEMIITKDRQIQTLRSEKEAVRHLTK